MNKKFESLFVGFGIVCMIVGLVSLAQSTTPSGGPYYLHVPTSTWTYQIGIFSNGSYYMVNGTNWKVDYQSTNASKVFSFAFGNLTSGGKILFKDGTYFLDSKIKIGSNQTLEGESHKAVLFANYNVSTYDGMIVNQNIGTATIDTDIVLTNFAIDGYYSAQTVGANPCGILFGGVERVLIDRLYTHDIKGHHIYIRYYAAAGMSGDNIVIQNCIGIKSQWNIMMLEVTTHWIIDNCYVEDSDTGISTWGGSYGVISNCIGYNNNNTDRWNNGVDIAVEGDTDNYCHHVTITGNTCNHSKCSIYIVWAYDVTITGNTLAPEGVVNGAMAISTGATYDMVIADNNIELTSSGSIGMGSSFNYASITGNIVHGGTGTSRGIDCDGASSNLIISNNVFQDIGTTGIDLRLSATGSKVEITGNEFIDTYHNTTGVGVRLELLSNSTLGHNIFSNIDEPIQLYGGTGQIIVESNLLTNCTAPTIQDSGTANLVRWNTGWKTEGSASANNATSTTWTFTMNNATTVLRAYASFNSSEVSSYYWSATGNTLTVTCANSATTEATRKCFVEWYCWDYP